MGELEEATSTGKSTIKLALEDKLSRLTWLNA
jgi:hypothetical protein